MANCKRTPVLHSQKLLPRRDTLIRRVLLWLRLYVDAGDRRCRIDNRDTARTGRRPTLCVGRRELHRGGSDDRSESEGVARSQVESILNIVDGNNPAALRDGNLYRLSCRRRILGEGTRGGKWRKGCRERHNKTRSSSSDEIL